MAYVDFIMKIHKATKRNYIERATLPDKGHCAEVALKFDQNYFDGDRKYGYAGYKYDGRWRGMAADMANYYKLKPSSSVLDIGCAKGFLLYEFTQVIPDCKVAGVDISSYAIENAKEEVKPFLKVGNATELPYPDKSFDFVVTVNTLHNLYLPDFFKAIREIERVGKGKKHIIIELYRNEQEKMNFLNWQLTSHIFMTPQELEWVFKETGYTGDYSFIAFE